MLKLTTIYRGKPSQVNIKEATSRLRFMLEGPWPSTSFVLCSSPKHELHNRNASIGQFYKHTYPPFRFCAGSTPKITNKNIQQRNLPGYIAVFLYLLWSHLRNNANNQQRCRYRHNNQSSDAIKRIWILSHVHYNRNLDDAHDRCYP